MDMDKIASRSTWLGRSLRWPLDRLPKDLAIPILSGPLRARRWIVGAGIHRCWMGTYESEKQHSIREHLETGMVACDIGANAGFYSLLMARAVGNEGTVYAFEPQPANLLLLERHLKLNKLGNVVASGEAISDFVGEARFATDRGSYQGCLEDEGQIRVSVVTLDHLFASGRLQPCDLIKIDVEGAELSVLLGAKLFLKRFRPVIFLATHGAEIHRQCCCFLSECGYRLRRLDGGLEVSGVGEIVASTR